MASGFKHPKYKDTFNHDYLLHLQALGRPDGSRVGMVYGGSSSDRTVEGVEPRYEIAPFTDDTITVDKKSLTGIKNRLLKKVGITTEQANDNQRKAWENVVATSHNLWTPRAMAGAEYEGGGFEANVAAHALKGDMRHHTMDDVTVYTEVFPSLEGLSHAKYSGSVSTLKQAWKDQYDVEVADDLKAKIHIIAPRDTITAAESMVRFDFGFATMEMDTHRGFGLREALAYQSLSDEDKAKMDKVYEDANISYNPNDNAAWFEIHSGVYITIDDDMFAGAQTAFDTQEFDREEKDPSFFASILPG